VLNSVCFQKSLELANADAFCQNQLGQADFQFMNISVEDREKELLLEEARLQLLAEASHVWPG
jgi:hypothetical protein